MEKLKETFVISIMSIMFWAVMYPQFSLAKETYVCPGQEEKEPEEDFFAILEASGDEIVIRSRFWELLKMRIK